MLTRRSKGVVENLTKFGATKVGYFLVTTFQGNLENNPIGLLIFIPEVVAQYRVEIPSYMALIDSLEVIYIM